MAKKPKVGVQSKVGNTPIVRVDSQERPKATLTKLEKLARREKSQSIRVASYGGDFGNSGGRSIASADANFYSPQLSTDFLELPQSEREKRELFRFWYNCFVPGTPITMADGTARSIETLNVGDKVLNGFGKPTSVIQTFAQDIDDNIIQFKVRGVLDEIKCTGNHPFLVYRAEQVDCKYPVYGVGSCKNGNNTICKQRKCSGIDNGKPEFVYAKDLKEGDYVCSPDMDLPEHSSFSRNQLRLLGYFAAEGSFSWGEKKPHRVSFSLNSNEFDTIADEIIALYKAEYGRDATKKLRPDSNSCEVRCYDTKFAEFCLQHVGDGSHHKTLSSDIMESPPSDILELLGAYWNGDGSFTNNGYVATTVSKNLANQVYNLSTKVGFPAFLKWQKNPMGKFATFAHKAELTYRIIIPYRYYPEFSPYANFVKGKPVERSTRVFHVRVGSNLLRRVEKIEIIPYKGPVYNIEVDGEGDDKSYIAKQLATHNTHPIVGAAIDFHTDVPMSKIRLAAPRGKDMKRNQQILHFYEEMCKRIRLFQTLYDGTHEYWLNGSAYFFCEDHDLTEEMPESLLVETEEEEVGTIGIDGQPKVQTEVHKRYKPKSEVTKNVLGYVREKYQGWQRIQILPPEQVKIEVFQYTNKCRMELLPSEKDRLVVLKAEESGDEDAANIANDIPKEIRDNLLNGQPIPLNTSPYDNFLCSSFCYHLAHKKSPYDERGTSLLERCLRTLLFQDKLRQSQTSIASRAMTPKRVIWADKMSDQDIDNLRDQVDQALIDPDFSIITNFELHWDEIGARDRLLDLSSEYEITNKMLYTGLRVTESFLTGESTYSGERIQLDVMNTMYLLYRETLCEFVEQQLFAPVAEKKGFWEDDEWGNKKLLFPKLQFTRLALRDNSELLDLMMNIHIKGSLPISSILELINIDPDDAFQQIERDLFTPRDPTFNTILTAAATKIGDKIGEGKNTNVMDKVIKAMGLKQNDEDNGRFSKDED